MTSHCWEYVDHDSEEAFATLVTRHVNKVYSVALRQTRNPHQAEEITQAVFVILAKKSRHLGRRVVLSGWLYQTARLAALTFIRGEIRRARREQEAQMQTLLNEAESDVWTQIAPLLDTAMAGLNEKDRYAVVLRFFDGKSMREVGAVLGGSEDAAKTRVNRAVEKLRQFFVKRGIASTAESIAGAIAANSVQVAPAALAKSVTAVAIAKGAAAGSSTLTLIKGALRLMAWTKIKATVIAGFILATTATTSVIGYKLVLAYDARPPLIAVVFDMQADGMVFARATIEGVNTLKRTMGTNDTDNLQTALNIEQFTDGTGQAIKYTKQPGDNGNPFKYTYTLNQPVPPGGKYPLKMEGTFDGMDIGAIKPTGDPDVFELQTHEQIGSEYVVHRSNVFRLPPGAVLLEKSSDLAATTNGGRVELRMDKMLPPPGKSDVRIRYRLPAVAK
jgi:RNA polymerase sigma factor (sigma-70 family)